MSDEISHKGNKKVTYLLKSLSQYDIIRVTKGNLPINYYRLGGEKDEDKDI